MSVNLDCLDELITLTAGHKVCVAYSGGVDSHVLLHLLATGQHNFKPILRAIYVHHGLQSDADKWAKHCATTAQQLAIPFQVLHVSVNDIADKGIEAAARSARYEALADALQNDEVLLTAHHQQDQAETLLLQLFRGAGSAGLAAMSPITTIHGMTVIRPFLKMAKQTILSYAEEHQLRWIEDPSNHDTQIYRNYLRHTVWPVLQQRWPAINSTLSRSAEHCRDSVYLMQDMARLDAKNVCKAGWHELDLPTLLTLPVYRQRNLLRFAIEQTGLELPSTAILDNLLQSFSAAACDKMPLVTWANSEARRYKQTLYLLPRPHKHQIKVSIAINSTDAVTLNQQQCLYWQPRTGQGLSLACINAGLTVRFRQGGERILLQNQTHHKTLKQLFQQWQIPPWQRNNVPLLFAEDELVAVVGYGYAKAHVVADDETGWTAVIKSPD